jgi:hypothetical protein
MNSEESRIESEIAQLSQKLSDLWQELVDVKEEKSFLLSKQKRNLASLVAMNELTSLGLFDTTPEKPIQQAVESVAFENASMDPDFWQQGITGVTPLGAVDQPLETLVFPDFSAFDDVVTSPFAADTLGEVPESS